MAMDEAVIYQQDPFTHGYNDSNYSFGIEENLDINWESPATSSVAQSTTSSSPESRRKRRRTKNDEEMEKQRMTHIAAERNRRRQMNDYLSLLRSLMPPSYTQRGDQASIVGGAINFVKELEQLLQSLEAYKFRTGHQKTTSTNYNVFSNIFVLPQYSRRSSIADIKVTMVENHANIKILLMKRPKQLLKMVVGFQSICLNILHLNVTTVDQSALYFFSVKVEEECELSTVNEIESAVHHMIETIQQDSTT